MTTPFRVDHVAFADALRFAISNPNGDGWKDIAYFLSDSWPGGMTGSEYAAACDVLMNIAWYCRGEAERCGADRPAWIDTLCEALECPDGLSDLASDLAFKGFRLTKAPDLGVKAMLEPSPAGIAEYARIEQMCAEFELEPAASGQ